MLPKRTRFWFALFIAISLLSLVLACNSKDDDEVGEGEDDETVETAGVKYTPKGNEGKITGTISFAGTAPEVRAIDMNADPACATNNPHAVAEDVVIKNGKLQYVFIYVKDGQTADGAKKINNFTFDVPATEAKLDQQGCHYVPHVLGMQTGQKLAVYNSDPTTHNVNVQPKSNKSFNQAQGQSAPPITATFNRAETLIPVKCNQHPWMKGWIGVLKHPFFGVSREDGTYEISGVPPGTYTVEAWHERYGAKTMQVTVAPNGSATADFSIGGATAMQRGSLEVMPALELPMLGHH